MPNICQPLEETVAQRSLVSTLLARAAEQGWVLGGCRCKKQVLHRLSLELEMGRWCRS